MVGYELGNYKDVLLNENGIENNYKIGYASTFKNEYSKGLYFYSIRLKFPSERVFNVDEYPLHKSLIKEHFGQDYDFVSFETWVQTHLENVNKYRYQVTSRKGNSSYNENLREGYDSEGQRELTYSITLQK